MKKRYPLVLSICLITSLLIAGIAFAGAPAKVDVCHLTSSETNTYVKINISENAYQTHLDHGDGWPYGYVPDMLGYAFDSECVPYLLATDTLDINGLTGAVETTNFVTKPGVQYLLEASGTYRFVRWATTANPDLGYADAKCSHRIATSYNPYGVIAWVDGALYYPEAKDNYGLQVSYEDGDTIKPLLPVGWSGAVGECNPSHEYTAYFVGNSEPIKLFIYDSYYGDNTVGPITVVITELPLLP